MEQFRTSEAFLDEIGNYQLSRIMIVFTELI
jgi:hypothetical protein